MTDLLDKSLVPELEDIAEYIRNPLFMQFCTQIRQQYQCREKIEYSSCSWEKGWNVKFKKSGKTLCTIYPREGFFTVLAVVGAKEKDAVEALLPDCSAQLQEIYARTKEGNGQRWMMIDLEDSGPVYDDVFRLIQIRGGR